MSSSTDSPWASCFAYAVVGCIGIAFLVHSCAGPSKEDLEKQEAQRVALEAADKQEAAIRGLSLESYRTAKWASQRAYAACKTEAESKAKYDYKSDWNHNADWTVSGNKITIIGHDIRMQNGFGVFGPVTYTCVWSMTTENVVSLDLKQD